MAAAHHHRPRALRDRDDAAAEDRARPAVRRAADLERRHGGQSDRARAAGAGRPSCCSAGSCAASSRRKNRSFPDGRNRPEGRPQILRQDRGRARRRSRHRAWRAGRHPRAVGLREVDAAAHGRRPRGDHRRRDRDRRQGRQQARAARARLRHGVPELRALSAYERRRQHRLCAEDRRPVEGRAHGQGAQGGGAARPRPNSSTASPASFPAASASASRWAAP